MTYLDLIRDAEYKLEHNKITLGEYNKMIEPLRLEIPKRGNWIPTNDYVTTAYGSLDYYRCSCCGEDSLEEGDYCPNCGARMAESEDKE